MNYWLMKSELNSFSIDDLQRMPEQTDHWDGVRNYQARNMLRDQMKVGDLAFFYHSSCEVPGIVGLMRVVQEGYPDSTAFDPHSAYYDPKSDANKPRWYMVDVQYIRHTKRLIPLAELKKHPALARMPLLQKGNRLSILPVSSEQWQYLLGLENA